MKTDYLAGIKVVDFTTFAAAPGAGRLMGDWGADVIKVESLGGDPMRWFGKNMGLPTTDEENPIWEFENGNKKSVTINLKDPDGMAIMMKLLEDADIFITNVRLGSLKKMGLDYESLAPKFPKLVVGHISGYGIYGEEAPRPGYDVVSFWARGGSYVDFSPIGQPPMTSPYGIGDHTTSLVLLGGVLAALNRAQKTGKGEKVEVSLMSAAIWVNSLMIMSTQYGDQWPKDRYVPSSALTSAYCTKDGVWVVLTITEYERYWAKLCRAIEIPEEVMNDPRFANVTMSKIPENSRVLVKLLEDAFAKKDFAYWAPRLAAEDIAYEKGGHYADIATDKQAIENHYVEKFTSRNGNSFMLPMSPVQFKENAAPDNRPAPMLGEHNEEVLKALGYTEAQIAELRAKKAIG